MSIQYNQQTLQMRNQTRTIKPHAKRASGVRSGGRSSSWFTVLASTLMVSFAITPTNAANDCACTSSIYSFILDFSGGCGDDIGGAIADQSCFVQSNATDSTPTIVTNIQFYEYDASFLLIGSGANAEGTFNDGDTVQYTSVTSLGNGDIPKGLTVTATGQNNAGESTINTVTLMFTNNCTAYPVLEDNASFGWFTFSTSTSTPPREEDCAAHTADDAVAEPMSVIPNYTKPPTPKPPLRPRSPVTPAPTPASTTSTDTTADTETGSSSSAGSPTTATSTTSSPVMSPTHSSSTSMSMSMNMDMYDMMSMSMDMMYEDGMSYGYSMSYSMSYDMMLGGNSMKDMIDSLASSEFGGVVEDVVEEVLLRDNMNGKKGKKEGKKGKKEKEGKKGSVAPTPKAGKKGEKGDKKRKLLRIQ